MSTAELVGILYSFFSLKNHLESSLSTTNKHIVSGDFHLKCNQSLAISAKQRTRILSAKMTPISNSYSTTMIDRSGETTCQRCHRFLHKCFFFVCAFGGDCTLMLMRASKREGFICVKVLGNLLYSFSLLKSN